MNDIAVHHMVMVFDGTQTGNANRLKVYVDGVQKTLSFVGTIPATTPGASNYHISGWDDGTPRVTTGTIDEHTISSITRSADWAAARYQSGLGTWLTFGAEELYLSAAELTSSAYDTEDSTNVISSLLWTETATSSTEVIKFQLRTAPDSAGSPGTWTSWLGPTGTGDYYTNAGGETINSTHTDGSNDQWVEYKVFFTSGGAATPSLSDVSLNYSYATNTAPTAPTTLYTNNITAQSGQANPTDLTDTTPSFSALCNDSDAGDILNKARIQVSTDIAMSAITHWDSGVSGTSVTNCTAGNRSEDIVFDSFGTAASSTLALDDGAVTYYWRVKFWDDEPSEGSWSATSTFTLLDSPTAPSSVSATKDSDTQFTINWTDNSSNEDRFEVERNTDAGAGFTGWLQVATTTSGTTSYVDNSVNSTTTPPQADARYQYRVRSANTVGNSSYDTDATVHYTTPADPSGTGATYVSDTQFTVAWTDNSAHEDGFKLERKDNGGSWSQIGTSSTSPYSDTTTTADNYYEYRTRSFLSTLNSGYSADATLHYTTPDIPTIGTPAVSATSTITWTWTDNSSYEDSFRLDYTVGTTTGVDKDGIVADATTWQSTGLSENTAYAVHAHAFRTDRGESTASADSSTVYTLAPTPTNFTSIGGTASTTVQVDTFSNDTLGSSGYYFTNTTNSSNSGWIANSFWSETGLTCGTSYDYTVKYRNGDGIETSTTSVSQSTDACAVVATPAAPVVAISGGGGAPGAVSSSGSNIPKPIFQIIHSDGTITYPVKKVVEEVKDILSPIGSEIVKNITSPIKKSIDIIKEKISPNEPKEEVISPQVPPVFTGNWDTLPNKPLEKFVLSSLPREINILAQKFPRLKQTFAEVGVSKISDLSKLKNVKLTLPALEEMRGVPLSELPLYTKQALPSEIVFARSGGELIDYSILLSLNDKGEPEQKISAISGNTMNLVVKPDNLVKSVKGYIVLKKIGNEQSKEKDNNQVSEKGLPLSSLLSSVLFTNPSLAQEHTPEDIEEKFVLLEFEYTDPDGDGIYTANIKAPKVSGEYEIITVMDYQDPSLGTKEIRLITLIDPEGYIYEKVGGQELRVTGATASLYHLNPKSKIYEIWPASRYQQDNPQTTDKTGNYSFLVPEGEYYLSVEAPGYLPYKGESFAVKEGRGIHTNIELKTKYGWIKVVDWKVVLIVFVFILLFYNFYRDKIRNK